MKSAKLLKERRIIPSRLPNRTRLTYIRYTDDWIVRAYSLIDLEIKDKIAMFLSKELELELSQDKTKITNLLRNKG